MIDSNDSTNVAGSGNSGEQVRSKVKTAGDMMGCCGSMMTEMSQGCSCGTIMKKHKTIFCLIFVLLILMFLVSQVGGILGILAFFRTF